MLAKNRKASGVKVILYSIENSAMKVPHIVDYQKENLEGKASKCNMDKEKKYIIKTMILVITIMFLS